MPAWCARIFFDAAIDRSVLTCDVEGRDPDGFDLARVGCFSAVLRGEAALEHVLLSDGLHRLRLDVRGGTVTRGPVCLRFVFDGLHRIDAPILTLQRLVSVARRGTFPLVLFARERRAERWIAALRADDIARAGGTQRDIAEALVGVARLQQDWGGTSDYLRSQVRRLLRFGRRMRSGGWRDLLDT